MQLLPVLVTLFATCSMCLSYLPRHRTWLVTKDSRLFRNDRWFAKSHRSVLSHVKHQSYCSFHETIGESQSNNGLTPARIPRRANPLLLLYFGAVTSTAVVLGSVLIGIVMFGGP
jgi:hypothetical protein